jgi:hypothetical protein
LLQHVTTPEAVDWASGRLSEAIRLVTKVVEGNAGSVDLVVIAHPTRRLLAAAHDVLGPGGEVYCEWHLPVPGGLQRVRQLLQAAGFTDIAILWPWPPPWLGSPQFWLPVGAPSAVKKFAALRPAATSRWQRAGRSALPAAAVVGLLAPVCAIARRQEAAAPRPRPADPLGELITSGSAARPHPGGEPSWALLTGGHRAVSKVVALPFLGSDSAPDMVVKFARVPEADSGLSHEAEVLSALAARGSPIPGVPQVLATGRRCGRIAVAESAIHGVPLLSRLTRETFPDLAARVTTWLIKLAGAEPQPRERWDARLVTGPLEAFERMFACAVDSSTIEVARTTLATLGPLPLSCEHRDCSPWNVILAANGEPALLDWESAEPQGLPAMDLIYFLTNAALVLEGTLESSRSRETYARVLDPATWIGRVAADCLKRYCAEVGVDSRTLAPLRLLCWIVHARSDHAQATADVAGAPSRRALEGGTFLRLIQEELRLHQGTDALGECLSEVDSSGSQAPYTCN